MKYFPIVVVFILTNSIAAYGQSPKTVIVEHFTNTRCSICASRNPGFYDNLENHPSVLHIAYHPSAPYSNCILNQHNVSGNDNRTNFYGVYGSTPKITIQGVNISPSTNYSSPSIFNPYTGQTSAFDVQVTAFEIVLDSIWFEVNVTALDTHSMSAASLYAAIVEDTIFYNAPNGEDLHFDVFRVAFTADQGEMVTLPLNGQTITYNGKVKIHPDWDLMRIYPMVILQETSSKSVIQAAKGKYLDQVTSTGEQISEALMMIPSFIRDEIRLPAGKILSAKVFSINGREVASCSNCDVLNISKLDSGIYFLQLVTNSGSFSRRVYKQ